MSPQERQELNELVERYAAIAAGGDADLADELSDHLLCLLEDAVDAEQSLEDGFETVSTYFGHPADIAAQFQLVKKTTNSSEPTRMTTSLQRKLLLGNAIIWAALILATSMVLRDSPQGSTVLMLVLGGFIASHLPLTALVGGGRAAACAEWAFLKRSAKKASRRLSGG